MSQAETMSETPSAPVTIGDVAVQQAEPVESFDLTGAYAAAVVLALGAVAWIAGFRRAA